ncbi:MAG TPA: prepilin-type N-terminal cleavage/methylation domain-containing protein [Tepidisphaeraceae bacterium]|nr:prepilin-type N-terminal cleavage/methylation domain-containing protein [Tepidisphaeraceae bacterium]
MSRKRGFTLVELLVVIALITLLIAILLTVISRALRPARVLASPIAYLNFPEKRLYVADARGQGQLDVYGAKGDAPQSDVAWSPSGQRIAFRTARFDRKGAPVSQEMIIVNPFTGQYRALAMGLSEDWAGWLDSSQIAIRANFGGLRIVDVESGVVVREVLQSVPQSGDEGSYRFVFLSPFPHGKQYIGGGTYWFGRKPQWAVIAVLRSDLSRGKIVWESRSAPWASAGFGRPHIDPTGQWVAWDIEARDGEQWKSLIAVKPIQEDPSRMPTFLNIAETIPGGSGGIVCDWTEDGNLLLNVYFPAAAERKFRLAVVDRNGRLLRVLPITEVGPELHSVSWRKYYHQ